MKKIFTVLAVAAIANLASAQIVINEIYGGGGNSGATLKNDFVELYNKGAQPVTLTGAYLQYTSTTGTFGSTTNPLYNKLALPNITLQPGQYYLIQLAAGNGGSVNLPTPDFAPTGTAAPDQALALSGTSGKIALTTDSTSPSAANGANVIDFVGWGAANIYEGSNPAPATTNSTSISRTNGVDTNNNGTDFIVLTAPTPQNSQVLATKELSATNSALVINTFLEDYLISNLKGDFNIYNLAGQLVMSGKLNESTPKDITALAPGHYILTVVGKEGSYSRRILKK